MDTSRLGKSGLKVSRLCLGMMTYGSSRWREWVLDEEQALPFVKRVLEELYQPHPVLEHS
jgi:1-deoxyxylulose-5-phosphate synthase